MAAVSTTVQLDSSIKLHENSDDEPYSPNTRDTNSPEYQEDDKHEERHIHTSSFSIHNVLKKERDSHSPDNVFSTDKLLENTPNYEETNDSRTPESSLHGDIEDQNESRAEISIDDNSCCSDDTVLSVGNEAPPSYNTDRSPETQGLTSFKHIQTHLNAISQLSQNLNINQPMLLRPSPINPNPLMFINQPLIFQNPILNQVDLKTNRMIPQGLNSQFGLNFSRVKNGLQDLRNSRTDENRRLSVPPRSPDNESERDFINQNCLKFSIDNILKADFGRRITDPLHKRKSLKARQYDVGKSGPVKEPGPGLPAKPEVEARVPEVKPGDKPSAIDLSKSDDNSQGSAAGASSGEGGPMVWPAWVYCTRYSDRPSSGRSKYGASKQTCPRTRRPKKPPGDTSDEKRPRTAFSGPQLARLKHEFAENRYLTERRRQALAAELGLAEAQIKIWFQNKRAKIKKASGQRNPLALQLMAQGLYNHSTVPLTKEEEELEMKAREREQQNRI